MICSWFTPHECWLRQSSSSATLVSAHIFDMYLVAVDFLIFVFFLFTLTLIKPLSLQNDYSPVIMFIIIVGRKFLSLFYASFGGGVTWSKINEWMSEGNGENNKKFV